MPQPIIPEYIRVHLGEPDEPAENIRVPFVDYIKNVASSEIYPTWPEAALRANILAEISYALNRVYTEWYPSRGYDFDITSSTKFDQKFIQNRDYFENISRIVDDIFNNYVVKQGSVAPYFTQYCDGRRVSCEGLSQWGTVDLANEGLTPYEILQYYYGDDINIVYNAPIRQNVPSYPGKAFRLGDVSDDVRTIKIQLNRIADNYPAIPKISDISIFYNLETEAAVKKFQEIFNLNVDGIVGKDTWYKIKFIYTSVKKLSELYSEAVSLEEINKEFTILQREGDTGNPVKIIQYYLAVIATFDDEIPAVRVDGIFDDNTKDAVIAFQKKYGLTPDGIVGRDTWNRMTTVYRDTIRHIPQQYLSVSDEIYPGRFLEAGMTGDEVQNLQKFLKRASEKDPSIPKVNVTGTFDTATEDAVKAIEARYGLDVDGRVGPLVWDRIVNLSKA